ncbi:3'-5' exonuclease [Candidatus Uhrbacteria bacterium CG10_big_fil_rev_8_21_14_0_10_48_11]|uniref:3'-5' exonuclease n=1 Tax=Candidatus Uhrbacteria bacterium CG10_big_fil_rev_8_21_14_0_10_48_11 TaxID=1975037 RepID=A0A2M8LE11_9BACT|nr:MAG: 3'-5' exonuclease [Candidatus Uhrbacteria bacterium CG10_big_fil_rev_8_21_14_0_10_48_11]
MAKLVFDIETIGENFDELDSSTQEALTAWVRRYTDDEDEQQKLSAQLKERLGLSPFTGEIVVLGVYDTDRKKGTVYYQAPNGKHEESTEGDMVFKPTTEKEMLARFWEGAKQYTEFISFNGRCFDAPFLAIRSAVHKLRPTKDLLSNRYLSSQRNAAQHIDLIDQLTFYGAFRPRPNLHLATRAFGIESPKEEMSGEEVTPFFNAGRYLDIARYNARDLIATNELYLRWQEYLHL